MADELLTPAAQGEEPTPELRYKYLLGRDPLELMRALKRWTRLVVYPAVTALIPLSHFVLGTTWLAAIVGHAVGGYLVATLGIEFGFWYGWRLRKEAAYSTMLAMDLGATRDFGQACERAVQLLAELLCAEKVVLTWRNQEDGSLTTLSTHGIPAEAMADATCLSWWDQNVRQAIDERKVLVAPAGEGHAWQSGSGGRSWVAYVPLLSLDKVVGLLVLVGPQKAFDLRDKMLLAPIGLAVGLTLENLLHTVELRRRTDEYVATTNLTGDIIAKLDKRGNWVFLNDAACQFYGKPREELLGTDSRVFLHADEVELTAQAIRQMTAKKKPLGGFVNRQVTPMGTRVVEWNGYPLFDEEGQYVGIQITGRDITERKQAEEALQESEEAFRLLFENAKDAIFHADPATGLIIKCNRAAETLLEKNREEIIGQPQTTIHPPQKAEHYIQMFKRHMEQQGFAEDEAEVITKSGKTKPVLITASVASVRGTPIIQGAFRDITERKKAEAERERLHTELEERAVTDSLTGLYNHAHFFQRLAGEIERSKRYNRGFAVVMMDVDNFKRFNDSHGHQAGDEALRFIADSIRSAMRRSDLAFRYGGDEFAAILLHADPAKAQAVVGRINRRITRSLKQTDDGAAAKLALSAGVACFPDDGSSADDLVKTADSALYRAKWLARARGMARREQGIESLGSLLEAPHEEPTKMPSAMVDSLMAALRRLGVPDGLADLNLRTMAALGTLAEIRDPYVRGHQKRTSDWAATLAEEMGLWPDRVRSTRMAGLVHDLGKAGTSRRILSKPGKLTEEEFAKIKEHPPLGSIMIISEIEALQQLVPVIRHHHERFDGKGYPDGLAGEDIPLEARILAVVDAFDAMTHERAYRKAMSMEQARAELERGASTQFDPVVVEAFLALVSRQGEDVAAAAQPASESRELTAVE